MSEAEALPGDCRRLVELSHEMLAAAREGRWAELLVLEEGRRSLLDACSAVSPAQAEAAARVLQEILAADAEVVALSEQARDSAGGELRELQKGQRATRAYTGDQD